MSQLTGQTTEFKTPNLDALAQKSVLFSSGYVSAPICSASRAGMLTGRYQQRFGTDYNYSNANSPVDGVPVNETLISESLKQAGYKTGIVGKWHIGFEPAKRPNNQGFDSFYGILEGGRPYFGQSVVSVRRNASIVDWTAESSFNGISNDPVHGRYLTDAFGDEAARFIAENAGQAEPFFLYVPFTSPHSPYDVAKAADLAQFDGTSLSDKRKVVAAATLAMDRAIGFILDRLEDPNNDGDKSDSVADNTIVVFLNDNGGPGPADPLIRDDPAHSNYPLRDYKGFGFEGGIRVPFMISAPGVNPGVFSHAVTARDLFPTFLAAAGAPIPSNLDSTNLMPYITGEQTGPVHDKLFWREGTVCWSYRQGDWKLTKPIHTAGFTLYRLNPDGSGESVNLKDSYPEIFNAMLKDFIDWEVTLAKPTNTTAFPLNRFDAFRFRTDVATNATWRDSDVWVNDDAPNQVVTLRREDPYANAVLAFQPRDDANFTSRNNISRATAYDYTHIDAGVKNLPGFAEFILNELRFTGQFTGNVQRSGTLTGEPLMFVKSLGGAGPRITLGSTAGASNNYKFNINMDVVLYDDLEINGDSTLSYAIGGRIRDFSGPRSVTKNGTSSITWSGNNTYFGDTIVNRGALRIEGASAALANTSKLKIGPQGAVTLASGRIRTPLVEIANGGVFNFTGGVLEAVQVVGDLTNSGGSFHPGSSPAIAYVSGDYTQTAGSLVIEIGGLTPGTQHDQLVVGDDAVLSGSLQISLLKLGAGAFSPLVGHEFEIIRAGDSVSGAFNSVVAPVLPDGRRWALEYAEKSVVLRVISGVPNLEQNASGVADFDRNNVVNAGDLAVWAYSYGSGALGNANGDGRTDGRDFMVWQSQFGMQLVPSSSETAARVADFDRNKIVDAVDFAAWKFAYGTGALGDANGDGRTDGRDFMIWQSQFGNQQSPNVADFDYNHVVDAIDLSLWKFSFGTSALGDANGDGRTDGRDFMVWQSQFGKQLVPGLKVAAAVPEPTAAALVVSFFLADAVQLRGGRQRRPMAR